MLSKLIFNGIGSHVRTDGFGGFTHSLLLCLRTHHRGHRVSQKIYYFKTTYHEKIHSQPVSRLHGPASDKHHPDRPGRTNPYGPTAEGLHRQAPVLPEPRAGQSGPDHQGGLSLLRRVGALRRRKAQGAHRRLDAPVSGGPGPHRARTDGRLPAPGARGPAYAAGLYHHQRGGAAHHCGLRGSR